MPDPSLAERIAAIIEAETKATQTAPEAEPDEPRPLAYRIPDAARMIGLGLSTVHREIAAGRLKKIKIRGRSLITDEELRRFLSQAAAG